MVDQRTQIDGQPDSSGESILVRLGSLGLKATRARKLIAERLAVLSAQGADFSTEDLWKELQADDPGIGRATVYRTVELFQREGLLDRIAFADGSHRYRPCGAEHHHHVTCISCQRVVEVDACLPPELLAQVADATDFAIEGHALEIFGRCAACKGRAEKP